MESACVSMAEGSQCQSSGLVVAIEGKDAVLHSSCKNDIVLSLAVPNKLLHEWSKHASVDYVQSLNSHIVGGVSRGFLSTHLPTAIQVILVGLLTHNTISINICRLATKIKQSEEVKKLTVLELLTGEGSSSRLLLLL